jgi:arylsulfatase A-like enzyme
MYMAFHAPHSPFQAPEEDVARYTSLYPEQRTRAVVAAMMNNVDSSIKRVTEALEARSFWEDTITVVISDNGGTTVETPSKMAHSNFPLRGGKGTTYEGGLRTMALVHTFSDTRTHTVQWQGIPTSRQGAVYNSLFSIADWFPTLVDFAGLGSVELGSGSDIDKEASGVSLADSLFYGNDHAMTRDSLLHTVFACNSGLNACGAIRIGDWKLSVGRWNQNFGKLSFVPADVDNGGGCVLLA